MRYNLRKFNNDKSKVHNKFYAEVERRKTLSTRGLAKHMSDHQSIYSFDVVLGVIDRIAAYQQQNGFPGVKKSRDLKL